MTFTKRDPQAPAGFYQVEAAGLHWLGEATVAGGLPVAQVLDLTATPITLVRYAVQEPMVQQAEEFGHRLALTHRAGAAHHGGPPPGVTDGFIATLPMRHLAEAPPHWGAFYADHRVEPFARAAAEAGSLSPAGLHVVLELCERLRDGDPVLTGPHLPAARLHGDLWSGNVLWTPSGPILIDPAAHGGHPQTDLAMLALFGLPHLDAVLDAYTATAPLPDGWTERMPVHQLHPLLVHAVLFGSTFDEQVTRTARAAQALT